MTWLFFALISVALTVAYGLISKKILTHGDDYHPIAYASVLFTVSTIYSCIFYFFSGPKSTDFSVFSNKYFDLILVLDIIFYIAAPSLYYRSLKNLPISEVTIVSSLVGVFALIFGVLLGTEHFSLLRAIGGLLIFCSIVLVTYQKKRLEFGKFAWFMIVASIFYALAAITDTIIISNQFLPYSLYTILNFGIPTFVLIITNKNSYTDMRKIIHSKKTIYGILLNGLFLLISFYAIFKAYDAGGTTSQVNLLISTETVLTVILAIFILQERRNARMKIAAGILATIGVYLISTVI